MGIFFYYLIYQDKFKIWMVTFFKKFFTQETIYHVRTEMRQSLVFSAPWCAGTRRHAESRLLEEGLPEGLLFPVAMV